MRIFFALAAVFLAAASCSGVEPNDALRVMTFNIRYGTAPDGEHRWELRRELVFELLEKEKPHILGLQEALDLQIDEIIEKLPFYGRLGVGRDDGAAAGEFSAVLYDRRRLKALDSGTFWFSETPEIPGSKSWGNEITRICTWACFRDTLTEKTLRVFNLHLDHQSQPSRVKSAELLLQRASAYVEPVIITGDFNAGENNPALRLLLEYRRPEESSPWLFNAFRALHADEKTVGTFHGFTDQAGEEMIDHILLSSGITVLRAEILRDHPPGRYPSDHFPVTATILIP